MATRQECEPWRCAEARHCQSDRTGDLSERSRHDSQGVHEDAASGNAYCFQVLSDRAFGKLKERHEVELGPYRDLSDDELREKIRKLERELGIQSAEPEVLPPASDPKPN